MRLARYLRDGWTGTALYVLLSAAMIPAQPLSRFNVSTWPSTTNYLGIAYFSKKADGQIRITAGGAYTLYLNGDLVGADDDPATVESYEVSFKRRENQVAVVVEYDGHSGAYGVFCLLDSEEEDFVSSPTDRSMSWFWSGHGLPNEAGADWTELRLRDLDDFEEDGEAVSWVPVQAGTLQARDFAEFADLDLTRAASIAGFPGGLAGHLGPLELRDLAGQNLAFNSQSGEPKLVDGNLGTAFNFRKGAGALLQSVETDLGRLFPLERVRVITQPPSRNFTYEDQSLRGYSILVSQDGVSFREVGSRNQITSYQETEVLFPPTPARYIRLTATEFSDRNASPRVGELEAYASGPGEAGTYLSPPLSLGTADSKNFERAIRHGVTPGTAEMDLRFRSGDDASAWSDWSEWSGEDEIVLEVPEPRKWLQFEARMLRRGLDRGPSLDSLTVLFDGGPHPASRAEAAISPSQAPIGEDALFTYSLQLDVREGDAGVGRLAVLTAWPAQIDVAAIGGLGGAAIERAYATGDSLVLLFDPPITAETGTEELTIPFTTRLLSSRHEFQGLLFAPGSSAGLRAGTQGSASTIAAATNFDIAILDDVAAQPRVFTPNADNINDTTVFGFILGRVAAAPVRFEVYDLSGRCVRRLEERRLDAGYYAPLAGRRAGLPGEWDGRDDGGDLLPPGLYMFRVVVDLEPDDEVAHGFVGLAY